MHMEIYVVPLKPQTVTKTMIGENLQPFLIVTETGWLAEPSFSLLAENLFKAISSNPQYVLSKLFPKHTK